MIAIRFLNLNTRTELDFSNSINKFNLKLFSKRRTNLPFKEEKHNTTKALWPLIGLYFKTHAYTSSQNKYKQHNKQNKQHKN